MRDPRTTAHEKG